MEVAAADQHFFAFLDRQRDLAIAANLQIAADLRKFQADGAVAVDHQRPGGKGVREHRHQRDRLQRRGEDRPAGGERVGGGAGRGGDDQAVGALREGETIVDVHLEFDHVRHFAGVQHHLVDGGADAALLVLFMHDGFQQETLFVDVLAFQHVRQLLQSVVGIEIGEEAEVAAVDSDHLDVIARQHARGAEHVAVAADHHCQVGALADIRQAAGHGVFQPQIMGDLAFDHHRIAAGDQPVEQHLVGCQR